MRWIGMILIFAAAMTAANAEVNQMSEKGQAKEADQAAVKEQMMEADRAARNGDWAKAVKSWRELVKNTDLSQLPSGMQSAVHYEYGRVLGVTCNLEAAAEQLNEALKVDIAAKGPVHMTLVELMRVKRAQKEYRAAAAVGDRAIAALQSIDAHNKQAAVFREILYEYADILRLAGGQDNRKDSQQVRHHASQLNVDEDAEVPEPTPYGEHCD